MWSYPTGGQIGGSPTVVGGYLYFGSNDYYLYCLNATTGGLIWKYNTNSSINQASPPVVGGLVYIGVYNKYLYCLNATDGTFVWSLSCRKSYIFGSFSGSRVRVFRV